MPVIIRKNSKRFLAGREEPEARETPPPSPGRVGPRLAGLVEEPLPEPSPEPRDTKCGRPPINSAAMTAAERKRRQRALAPVKRIIKELRKIEAEVDARIFMQIFEMVRERIRRGEDERIVEVLKLIRQQVKDDHAKHRPQGFFMKDAPAGKGLLLTGEYTGEKLALIDAYQDPGWDGEKSTFGLATKKKPVVYSRRSGWRRKKQVVS